MGVSGFRFCKGHITDNGYIGELLDIGTSFDTETEQVQEINDSYRNAESEHEGYHVDFFALGRYREIIRYRIVNDFGIIGGGGQRDVVFLAFLQQHEIKSGFDFLLALDADKAAFLSGGVTDASGVFACLAVEVGFGDEQSLAYAGNGCNDTGAHVLYVAVETAYNRIGFRRGAQQAVAFQNQGVELRYESGQGFVVQPTLAGRVAVTFSGFRMYSERY